MASTFERELEFVQLLCNPEYIRWLHRNGYFSRGDFREYLKYLLYFRDFKYSRFLLYPQCIPILEILTSDEILSVLSDESFFSRLADEQYYLWRHRE